MVTTLRVLEGSNSRVAVGERKGDSKGEKCRMRNKRTG